MTARISTTRLDVARHTLRCDICADEIPFPLGDVAWVLAITRAFADAHRGRRHQGGRTAFARVVARPREPDGWLAQAELSDAEVEALLTKDIADRSAEVTGV